MRLHTSIVPKVFGISGEEAQRFLSELPDRWAPRVIMAGYWDCDTQGGILQGDNTRIIRLENFPTDVLDDEPCRPNEGADYQRFKKRFKRLRDEVLRWLYKLEDAGHIFCSNGGALGSGIGSWCSRYSAGEFQGKYTASITRIGPREAMMVAHLTETSIARPTRTALKRARKLHKSPPSPTRRGDQEPSS